MNLKFIYLDYPETAEASISGSVDLVIDSTIPKVADIRYHDNMEGMHVSFAYEENIAGIDEASLKYMLTKGNYQLL